jgi:hypothetical protein
MHITTITLDPMSKVFSCIKLNSRSLLKSLELTISHLKVGKFKKKIKLTRGPTDVVTTNIKNILLPQIIQ